MLEPNAFVDYAKISVEGGDGGRGCVSFRREKFVPRGGPDGGDGGRGGHIFLQVDPHMATLLDLRLRPHYRGTRGQHGMGSQCSGKGGDDVVVQVPIGTVVHDEEGRFIADLTQPGEMLMVAKGGDGGRGNQHFANSVNHAPVRYEEGWPGEKKRLILELKVIADVGLVGMPNAGKSTLLKAVTHAEPKIASYPFTTLSPNLGVYEYPDLKRLILADIPGLIEGAHQGLGLGDRFLRHIERTRLLVILLADFEQSLDAGALRDQFDMVYNELSSYSTAMVTKPFVVCFSRCDEWLGALGTELAEKQIALMREALAGTGALSVHAISSHTGMGLGGLMDSIRQFFETETPGGWTGNLQYVHPGLPDIDPHRRESLIRGGNHPDEPTPDTASAASAADAAE